MAVSKIQTGLRIEEAMWGKLKTLSDQETRSLNNLIEHILKLYVEDYEATHGDIQQAPYQGK